MSPVFATLPVMATALEAVLLVLDIMAFVWSVVMPTFPLFTTISAACCVVIPTLAVLATTLALAETAASVYPTFKVFTAI